MTTNPEILFEKIRSINEQYLTTADSGYKLAEEYSFQTDIRSVELLRDAFNLLVYAINFLDDSQLDEYKKVLQKLNIRAICKLLMARIMELIILPVRITEEDKAKIKKDILDIHKELTDARVEFESETTNARLDQIINHWKDKSKYIEKFCQKYNFG